MRLKPALLSYESKVNYEIARGVVEHYESKESQL